MPTALSDQAIRGLRKKNASKRADVWDSTLSGLVLRFAASGAVAWWIWYRTRAGVKRWHAIGPYRQFGGPGEGAAFTVAEARKKAGDLLGLVRDGGDPAADARLQPAEGVPVGPVLTLEQLARDALDALRPPRVAPSTHKEWRRIVRVELAPWRGQDPAASIRRRDAREFLRGIVERGAPSTANHVLDCARRLYAWGLAEELLEANPWAGLESPAARKQSDRVLSLEEVAAVWRALDVLAAERTYERKGRGGKVGTWTAPGRAQAGDVVRLLLFTGVRREAALGLHRREVEGLEGDAPVWTVPPERVKAKRGQRRPHVVPLSPAAAGLLRRRFAGGEEFAFPVKRRPGRRQTGPMSWGSHFVELLCAEADRQLGRPLEPWTIHNLRHTVATNVREQLKVREDVIELILGHVRGGGRSNATRIYLRAQLLDERREALSAWATLIASGAPASTI